MERFRIAKGKMLVIPPGKPGEVKAALLVWDSHNQAVGVQIIDEPQLRGFTVFVREADFVAVKDKGKPVNELRVM